MKVWIVEHDNGDYNNVCGVYSSPLKAYEAIHKFLIEEGGYYDPFVKELDRHYEDDKDNFYSGDYYADMYELDN